MKDKIIIAATYLLVLLIGTAIWMSIFKLIFKLFF